MLLDQNSMILARKPTARHLCQGKSQRAMVLRRAGLLPERRLPNLVDACAGEARRYRKHRIARRRTVIDPTISGWRKQPARSSLPYGCGSEILITYTGGFDLPDEAPLDLQRAAGLELRQYQTQAAQEATSGAGIRLLQHKDSRIVYFSPRDMAGGSG